MYKWSVQDKIRPNELEDVLNDFDNSGFDIYQITSDAECYWHTVIGRLPEMPLEIERELLDKANL